MDFFIHAENPAKRVEEAFSCVQRERMAEVPILNPALAVQAVGFQRWRGHWLGVLVTPWLMSLLLLPGKREDWAEVAANPRQLLRFPVGDVTFVSGQDVGLGEFLACSLFSPMESFSSQDEAIVAARAALDALLRPAPTSESTAPQAPVSSARRRFLASFMRDATAS